MTHYLKFKYKDLPWLTLLAGSIGLLLRFWLMAMEDEKGFLPRWHISAVLLTALSCGVFAGLFLATRKLTQGSKYRFNFPPSPVSAGFTALAAAGFGLVSIIDLFSHPDTLELLCAIVGISVMPALLLIAFCRLKGLRPTVLAPCAVCVWLMLRLICMYRSWSSDPKLWDYGFQLLALVCAMLSCYQRACFGEGMGKRFPHAFFSLACVYCCCVSLSGPGSALVYLCLGLWQLTDLCSLRPMKRRKENNNEAQ